MPDLNYDKNNFQVRSSFSVTVSLVYYTSVEILGLQWLNTVPPTSGTEVNFCSYGTAVSHKSDTNPKSKPSA
jgi:hypothetical protein